VPIQGTVEQAVHCIEGLTIGQAFSDGARAVLRVVVIDPVTHVVEAETVTGDVVVDDIAHFTATHAPLRD
jgi:hypothetical protein